MSTEPVVSEDVDVTASQPEVPSSQLPELTIGGGGEAPVVADPAFQPIIRGKIDRFGVAMGTGRRKTSVARVRIKEVAVLSLSTVVHWSNICASSVTETA